ncbi:hypothetical protein NIES4071_78560 [Calothrix sp. NIES-4071]|nr:hypothetical protein NIES4071_78560 [Calothrix sp. NIES-4071]BAZ62128.1 hypothetical protein NIES4105_78490 [Calothrix sp. NIES-4105]
MPYLFIHYNPKYIVTNKTNTETLILSQTQPIPPEVQSNQPPNFEILPGFSLIFPAIIVGVFVLVFGLFGYAIFKGISTAAYNRKQPIINREAKVVSKRQHVSGGGGDSSTSTSYYITFEFADGSREEFALSAREYGLIAEGDKGTLHSQGTWYKNFKRQF